MQGHAGRNRGAHRQPDRSSSHLLSVDHVDHAFARHVSEKALNTTNADLEPLGRRGQALAELVPCGGHLEIDRGKRRMRGVRGNENESQRDEVARSSRGAEEAHTQYTVRYVGLVERDHSEVAGCRRYIGPSPVVP